MDLKISSAGDSGARCVIESENFDLVVDQLLIAVGRAPNVENLGLEKAGVEFDARRGVAVDDRFRTSNPRIYAAGDVCSKYKFTHAADFYGSGSDSQCLVRWPGPGIVLYCALGDLHQPRGCSCWSPFSRS